MAHQAYTFTIYRSSWLIVACALLGAVGAFAVSTQLPPVYCASATLLVQQAPSQHGTDYQDLLTSERLARTYSEMVTGWPIVHDVAQRLELSESPADLANRVSVELVQDTRLIRLHIEHTDPQTAARVANAVADAFVSYTAALQRDRYAQSILTVQRQIQDLAAVIQRTEEEIGAPEPSAATVDRAAERVRLEGILAGYRNTQSTLVDSYEAMRVAAAHTTPDVILFERARVPPGPVRPETGRNSLLGGALGSLIGMGTALLVQLLDHSIRSSDDVTQATGLQTLGTIGRARAWPERLMLHDPLSPVSANFHKLRANLESLGVDGRPRTVLVTSPGPREGRTTVAANLAVAAARVGRRAVLVEADLRQPRSPVLFQPSSKTGLTDALLELRLDEHLQPTEVEGLRYLAAGDRPPDPAGILGSDPMGELLEQLLAWAEWVVIDGAPLLPVADSVVLSQRVDGVLLVLDVGRTTRRAARAAVESLQHAGANLVGAVLNDVPAHSSLRHRSGNGSGVDPCGWLAR